MRKRKCNAVGRGNGRLKVRKFETEGKEGKQDVERNRLKIFVVRKRTKNNVTLDVEMKKNSFGGSVFVQTKCSNHVD